MFADDEDEEALSHSIIKISKKELNDLVTELFSIMPEATEEELLADNIANSVLTDHSQTDVSTIILTIFSLVRRGNRHLHLFPRGRKWVESAVTLTD